MLHLCPVYGQDKVEKCLIYPLDMPEISLWYAWDKMTALNQMRALISLYMRHSEIAYQTE